MQIQQRKQYSPLHTLMQFWNEQISLSIRYSYVHAGTGFTAIGKNNSDKIRPWFER
jgi:hypothetical protein